MRMHKFGISQNTILRKITHSSDNIHCMKDKLHKTELHLLWLREKRDRERRPEDGRMLS